MHAGFGAQQAEGVFALDFDGGALDARHIPGGFVFDGGFEALALGVLQVLAQQHAGPVAGLGATRTGLQVQKAGAGIGRLVEHAAEFKALNDLAQLGAFGLNGFQSGFITFFFGHFEQLGVVGQFGVQALQHQDHIVQGFLFFGQFLGFLGIVPNAGVFQRRDHCAQAVGFGIVVKDTPEDRPRGG